MIHVRLPMYEQSENGSKRDGCYMTACHADANGREITLDVYRNLGSAARVAWRVCVTCGEIVNTPDRLRNLHALKAGRLCHEGRDGTCVECGVSLSECDRCHGVGYHEAVCAENEGRPA